MLSKYYISDSSNLLNHFPLCLCPLQVAQLFASGSPGEVVLSDCHQLDAPAMTALLQECVTPR